MSSTGPRKSMEDVLAAIRRIVRNEKPLDEAAAPDTLAMVAEEDDDDAPLTLTPAMRLAPDAWTPPVFDGPAMARGVDGATVVAGVGGGAAPMARGADGAAAAMVDASAGALDRAAGGDWAADGAASAPPSAAPPSPEARAAGPQRAAPLALGQMAAPPPNHPAAESPPAPPSAEAGGAPSSTDFAAMVRAPAAPPPPDPADGAEDAVMIDEAALEDMVRRIVRDELMGEMGMRMSKNVTRLIQDEVARQLAARG